MARITWACPNSHSFLCGGWSSFSFLNILLDSLLFSAPSIRSDLLSHSPLSASLLLGHVFLSLHSTMTSNGKSNGNMNGHNGHATVIKASAEPDSILTSLGLTDAINEGLVSDAQIKLKGELIDTYCPSTGKALGQVQTVS